MKKELIICLSIIILIIVVNAITQNYTKACVSKMNEKIGEVKQTAYENINIEKRSSSIEPNSEEIERKISNLENIWNEFQEKLAYYIEHDELEKVETQIYAIKGSCEVKKYDEILPEAEKCSFILKHIEEKTKLSVKNIF